MWLILLTLFCYRVTRLVVRDSIWEGTRDRLGVAILGQKPKMWRDKIYELLNCPFCMSIWISAVMVFFGRHWVSIPLPVVSWLAIAAGAMVWWKFIETEEDK